MLNRKAALSQCGPEGCQATGTLRHLNLPTRAATSDHRRSTMQITEEMLQHQSHIEHNTIELCVSKGCGTHFESDMIQCVKCKQFMCTKHVCACPIAR